MAAPRKLKEPEKEVRFTRSGQAMIFGVIGVAFVCIALSLFILSTSGWTRSAEPVLEQNWLGLLAAPFAITSLWAAAHLARHAYIIFTPLGIELFPFWRPSTNMQALFWQEIEGVEITPDQKMMEITLISEGDQRIYVSLDPLSKTARPLLIEAVQGIQKMRSPSSQQDTPS